MIEVLLKLDPCQHDAVLPTMREIAQQLADGDCSIDHSATLQLLLTTTTDWAPSGVMVKHNNQYIIVLPTISYLTTDSNKP